MDQQRGVDGLRIGIGQQRELAAQLREQRSPASSASVVEAALTGQRIWRLTNTAMPNGRRFRPITVASSQCRDAATAGEDG